MPIRMVNERLRLPVIGKIRLGMKKIAQSGVQYPATVEYFILKDEDGCGPIKKVYGESPSMLDILFPVNDEGQVIPTWLKLYGAAQKTSSGISPGRLKCFGDGPDSTGNPGVATWLDKKDPITGIAPQRPCLGARCPDWKDASGRQQCRQQMQTFVILPRVTYDGVFQIDTTSWMSITSFHSFIGWQKQLRSGKIAGIPYMIYREEEMTSFTDPSGKVQTGKQFIMKLGPNPDFMEKHGEEAKGLLDQIKNNILGLPSAEELVMLPTSSAFNTDPHTDDIAEEQERRILTAEEVVRDPEVVAAFEAYEAVLGKKYNDKARLVAVRKKEHLSDIKAAVLAQIAEGISIVSRQKEEPVREGASQPPCETTAAEKTQDHPTQTQKVDGTPTDGIT